MRKDLKMRKGKISAQAGHACMKIFFDLMQQLYQDDGSMASFGIGNKCIPVEGNFEIQMTPEMAHWKNGAFIKICVYVNSDEELLDIVSQAEEAGLPVALITDSGQTEFNGVPTNTCCAIGPDLVEKIDKITGDLPLY